MRSEKPTVVEQLENALLKAGPGVGAMIGGLAGGGLLRDFVPPVVGFILGGALGGVTVFAIVYGFFLLVNPKRDRGKK